MLQNMRDASVVGRVRLEANGKDIVLVVPRNVQVLGACFLMLQMKGCKLKFRYMLSTLQGKAMDLLPRFEIVARVSDRSKPSTPEGPPLKSSSSRSMTGT